MFVAAAVADVPLAGGHDLEWTVTLLEEFHGVGDGRGFASQRAGSVSRSTMTLRAPPAPFAGEARIRLAAVVGRRSMDGVSAANRPSRSITDRV